MLNSEIGRAAAVDAWHGRARWPQRAGDLDLFLRRIEANAHAVRVSRSPQDQKSGGGFLPTADS